MVKETASIIQTVDEQLFIQNYGTRSFCLTRGEGCWVWDENNNKYFDCTSGIAVNAFGHCFKPVVDAVLNQSKKLIHCSNLFITEPQQALARLLIQNTGLQKVFFCNSGTEAVEGAIKFARKYHAIQQNEHRNHIISFERSFHGRTYGALAATGQPALKAQFGPMPPAFICCPVNDLHALEQCVTPKTAAIIIEPILMEGGIITPDRALIKRLQSFQEEGILIIADEIQTGLGRTGRILASEAWPFVPDIVLLAKPLGGGLPLGAVLVKDAIADTIKLGDHGSTFGGNPVSCAAGVAVFEQLMKPGFLQCVADTSYFFRQGLSAFARNNAAFGFSSKVLGEGFLAGLKYDGDLPAFMAACKRQALLVLRAGKDVLRLLPPLNISRAECELVFSKLQNAAAQLLRNQ